MKAGLESDEELLFWKVVSMICMCQVHRDDNNLSRLAWQDNFVFKANLNVTLDIPHLSFKNKFTYQ
jgi:hypothetical protein